MPELPEVETVKRSLKQHVIDKEIAAIKIYYQPIVKSDLSQFANRLINQRIKDITRRGKFLIFHLTEGFLLSHLRMEGKYFLLPKDTKKMTHEHVRIDFKDGMSLRYHDVRKFGTMHYRRADELYTTEPLAKLGFEYDDQALDPNLIYRQLKASKRTLKSVLLDQTIITGIGNIYADEVCFCMKKHPAYQVSKISKKTVENMLSCIHKILDKAVLLGGSSIRSYKDTLGFHGRFQNELSVHLREGKSCPVCFGTIDKIKVSNRGTYLCKACQKKY